MRDVIKYVGRHAGHKHLVLAAFDVSELVVDLAKHILPAAELVEVSTSGPSVRRVLQFTY